MRNLTLLSIVAKCVHVHGLQISQAAKFATISEHIRLVCPKLCATFGERRFFAVFVWSPASSEIVTNTDATVAVKTEHRKSALTANHRALANSMEEA